MGESSEEQPARGPAVRHDLPWLQQYLAFGFVPEIPAGEDPLGLLAAWSRPRRRTVDEVRESDLVREGARALRAAFEEAAEDAVFGDQVVFLSGGLDSRTILGGLLDLYTTKEVVAATFGRPGEGDFDYASKVAVVAGVRHETLESFSVPWSTQTLVDSVLAREVPLPYPFGQRYLSYLLHRQIGAGNVFWDGLCGDAVSGDWAPGEGEERSWDEAVAQWRSVHLVPRWRELSGPGFDPAAVLPVEPFCPPEVLSYPDQLDFGVRQARRTATRRLRDFTIKTPFLGGPWLDFMLSVPARYRSQQYMYMEVQKAAFPRLFSLPLTTFGGGSLTEPAQVRAARELAGRVRRRLGRLGLPGVGPAPKGANSAIRGRYLVDGEMRDLVRENLDDLQARGILDWLDVMSFVGGAESGADGEHSPVTILLGLELNLKALDRRP